MVITFLDLFAGAGGLSEGFIQSGFYPLAHVEMDLAACYTLQTRMAYHWLKDHCALDEYSAYLQGRINRTELYKKVPVEEIASVINTEISQKSLGDIFYRVDSLLNGKKLDLIIGGPPCQAYSLIGRARDNIQMKQDKRNYLYIYYAEFLKRYKPRFFVFENVLGLLSAKTHGGERYFDKMINLLKEAGYETEYQVLSTEEYGVLQNRKRIILVGKKGKLSGFFPEPDKWNPSVNVWEIFKDMPVLKSGEGSASPCRKKKYSGKYLVDAGIRNNLPLTWHWSRPHQEQDLEIYRIAVQKWNDHQERLVYNDLPERLKTHNNRKSFLDRFKVVAANLPFSHTVVAHIAKDGHYYIHPDIQQNRSLTPREVARLQTFPDDYYFESALDKPSRTAAYRQIGNAVPVLLAEKIAKKLMENW